ncbi:hypothetical protein O7047_02870 [Pseudenterobacter timonensis]|uniref:Uncharacterized protein n=1 Tax=Pseudenterobacter timonensis TaxID=1755099 RepID=A0AAE4DKI9_9ENTR|nr:hypothetical protein [Pseudenterobacter timonensis]MDR9889176.1 hypothetical protein [Pseudenterobacter timonensis]
MPQLAGEDLSYCLRDVRPGQGLAAKLPETKALTSSFGCFGKNEISKAINFQEIK